MSWSISIAIRCDARLPNGELCGCAMDTMGRNVTDATEDARTAGWSVNGRRSRCPDCRKAGNGYKRREGGQ